jgi:HlyD family secretion protein
VQGGKTLLASIEPKDPELLDARAFAEARVKAADAKLKQAGPNLKRALDAMQFVEKEHGRIQTLRKNNAAADADVDEKELLYRTRKQEHNSARFAEEIARFELEMAKAALLRTQPNSKSEDGEAHFQIRSPITGRVLRVFQESATIVSAGTRLLELGDPQDLEVEIDVLSSDAVRIQPGNAVLLEHWGGEKPLRRTIRLVEPSAFTKIFALGVEEQRVNVIIDFVDPTEQRKSLGDAYRVEA